MDVVLAVIAVTLLVVGFIGCVVPALPGPPISYFGLLFMQWSGFGGFSATFLITWAFVTIGVMLLDFYLPVWMTRHFGGSRAATIGSGVGLIAGFFLFPPVGLVICPFLGALIGELIHDNVNSAHAFKVALGAFLAFMLGTGLKIIAGGGMIFYGIRAFFV